MPSLPQRLSIRGSHTTPSYIYHVWCFAQDNWVQQAGGSQGLAMREFVESGSGVDHRFDLVCLLMIRTAYYSP